MSVEREIARLEPEVVIHGAAKGADTMAATAQRCARRIVVEFPADWVRDGKAAGPIRNARMLADGAPDRGLAFGALWKINDAPRGKPWKLTGTGDMVRRMLAVGIAVRWVDAPEDEAHDLTLMPPDPSERIGAVVRSAPTP